MTTEGSRGKWSNLGRAGNKKNKKFFIVTKLNFFHISRKNT